MKQPETIKTKNRARRDGQKPRINPDYLTATHHILWMYPEAPSFDEQIRHDQEAQDQLEKELCELQGQS